MNLQLFQEFIAQLVKNLPAMQETQVQSLDWEDPLEMGIVTHSSIVAWRVVCKEKLVGYILWGHKSQT